MQMCKQGLCFRPLIGAPPSHCCSQCPQIIGAAGGAGRIFAALLSGHDHVAAEAARLLLRFFAPSAARAGVGPWAGEAGAGSAAAAPQSETNEEEAAAAHSAKSVCFISQTRQVNVWGWLALFMIEPVSELSSCLLLGGFALMRATPLLASQPLPNPLSCPSSTTGVPRWCVCCASLAAPRCSAWLWLRPWRQWCASPAAAPQTRQLWTLCCRQGRCMPGTLRTLLCLVHCDTVANISRLPAGPCWDCIGLRAPRLARPAQCSTVDPTTSRPAATQPLQETAALGRPLFTLFSHPAPRVAHAAALLMRAVAEGGAEAAQPMREAALTGEEGLHRLATGCNAADLWLVEAWLVEIEGTRGHATYLKSALHNSLPLVCSRSFAPCRGRHPAAPAERAERAARRAQRAQQGPRGVVGR